MLKITIVKFFVCLFFVFFCGLIKANNGHDLLQPSLFWGSSLFSNVNIAQRSEKNFRFQILYENRFLLKDLSPKFIGFDKKHNNHHWSASFSEWGNEYYRERALQGNYALKLTKSLRAGVGLLVQVYSVKQQQKSKYNFIPCFGVNYQMSDENQVFTSLRLFTNPLFAPLIYAGFSRQFAPKYQWFVLLKSSPTQRLFVSMGARHKRESGNEFTVQVSSKYYPMAIAYRLVWKQLSFRISAYYHMQLGISNHVGVGYQSLP